MWISWKATLESSQCKSPIYSYAVIVLLPCLVWMVEKYKVATNKRGGGATHKRGAANNLGEAELSLQPAHDPQQSHLFCIHALQCTVHCSAIHMLQSKSSFCFDREAFCNGAPQKWFGGDIFVRWVLWCAPDFRLSLSHPTPLFCIPSLFCIVLQCHSFWRKRSAILQKCPNIRNLVFSKGHSHDHGTESVLKCSDWLF